ncbi:hypothetical protein CVT24_010826 [Panaeolus cyanescens]|uniref:F-box domain-containing protein n=1 Tax=Panaeolus cyanescens TaxID=181874 RepID=A0A409VH18_9AGAR|nr:hypothetical protein CVT24_010826 [Panaeolus cyanescens]
MAVPNLPLDIVAEIIDILAETKDWETLKTFSTLCSFCRDQCRKHMFSSITIGEDTDDWDEENEAFPMPEILKFVALTKDHPQVLGYIRHLYIINPTRYVDQVALPHVFPLLVNLSSLEIHIYEEHEWWSPHLTKSLEALSGLPSFERLSLHGIKTFVIHNLAPLYQLRHLELDHVDLVDMYSPAIQYPPMRLQSLVHIDFDEYDYDPKIHTLKAKREDGQFLLDLSELEELHLSPFINTTSLQQASEVIQCHNVQHLKQLSLGIEYRGDNELDPYEDARCLQGIILPQRHSLKKLVFCSRYGDLAGHQDPYSTLIAVLNELEPDNVLTSLEVTIYIIRILFHDVSMKRSLWKPLSDVLTKPGWKHLSSVSLKVWTFEEDLQRESKKLHDYLKPLSEQPFKFTLNLRA